MKSWENISLILKESSSLPSNFLEEVLEIKEEVSDRLYEMNKFTELTDPEVFFEIKTSDYAPYKISYFNNNLYFINPYAKNVFELTFNKEGKLIYTDKKIDFINATENYLLFFAKPNQILTLGEEELNEKQLLASPYPNYEFNDFVTYRNNIYLLDRNNSRIVKYSYLNDSWVSPQIWLEKNTANFKSMAIDGSIWLLTEDNQIERYYGGKLQQKIELNVFPEIKDISYIFTYADIPYIYLIEPINNRIIITDKSGNLVQQYQSESFDNLLGLTAVGNGRTIYVLSGSKIYNISF
jgi:hypothetical protein